MATNYSPLLQLALPTTGELSGTWGDVVNNNITSMIEQAVAGMATISTWTTNSHTLTVANGTTDEARCAMLVFTTGAGGTALTAAGTAICPATTKLYIAKNNAAYAVTLKTAAGTGVAVPPNQTLVLMCDGTNVVTAASSLSGAQTWLSSTISGTTIDLAISNFYQKTITADTTFTVTNVPPSGTVATFYLELTNPGAYNTLLWSGVKWANNAQVSFSTTGTDLFQFTTDNGGTTWYGQKIGSYGAFVRSTAFDKDGVFFGGSNNILSIVTGQDNYYYAFGKDGAMATAFRTTGVPAQQGAWTYSNSLQQVWGYGDIPNVSSNFYVFSGGGSGPVVVTDGNGRVASNGSQGWITTSALTATTWGANRVTAICPGSGFNFVFGGDNGKIATTSSSLQTWTYYGTLASTTFGTQTVAILMYNTISTVVAVGSTAGVGTSTDNGATWTYQAGLLTAWTSGTPVAGLYANSIYMVVGNSGKVATSTDGVTWTNQAGLSGTTWGTTNPASTYALTYTGSAWVVVAANGVSATSTDNGVTWTYYTTLQSALGSTASFTSSFISGVTSSASATVLAYGAAGVFAVSSDNGATWATYDGPAQALTNMMPSRNTSTQAGIVWNGTCFLYTCGSAAAISYDGVNWTPRLNGFRNKFNFNGVAAYGVVGYGAGTHMTVSSSLSSSTSRVMTSTDNGATWTAQGGLYTVYNNFTAAGIAYGNSRFLLAGNNGTTPYSTDGGVTWTASTTPYGSAPTLCAAFGNGLFVIGSNVGRLATSTTGATGSWTDYTATINATTFGTAAVRAVVWANSQFVVGGDSGRILTSPDGVTWTYRGGLVTALAGTIWSTSGVRAITWTGTEYILVGTSGLVASSPDGITWTNLSASIQTAVSPAPFGTISLARTGNTFSGVASNGTTTVCVANSGYMVVR